ncbi:MAG: outer membrane beta-barrel protein, partial [Ginsengibacter sp.]
MLRIILLLACCLAITALGFAQNSSIKGTLTDSSNNEKAVHAVISLLRSEDSTLVTFSRSDQSGNFKISHLDSGKYIVLITYPQYGDYVDKVELKPAQALDFKTVFLTQKAKLMEEIIIRQSAVRIKGDTTEFTADSFHVKANATVEDLLKNLPGVQVDKDGKITAQGEQIQKVLVDGEEFFSDDPTIATRNLRADAVDKVQVFDKKSDQAVFTGIDDGQKTKTLNLKLKENAKHGYFGKLAAAGLDKYYNGQALINSFKAKRQFSAFGIISSTDATGLNWQDSRSYGFANDNVQVMDGGGIMITSSGDDLGTQSYYGQGLPESVKAGVHFSNKWNNDKYNAGGNYLFNKLSVRSAGNTYRQNILQDSVYYNRESADSYSDKMRHSVSGMAEIQLDSSSSIKVVASGNAGTSQGYSNYNSEALSQENQLVNSSVRNTSSKGDNSSFNSSVLWRKKFKKAGRTLSVNFDEKYGASNSNGFLHNRSDFYDETGFIIKKDSTDQNKVNDNLSNVMGARATYTESLTKKSFLELNYSFYNNSSTQKRSSYDKDLNEKYSVLVDSLSNDFQYVYKTHSAGINYRYNDKKYNFSFGGNIANTAFQQTDQVKDTTRKYSYYNLFPQANFNYKFNPFSSIRFNYNGSTQQPTIDQLQPLKNNDDPLNIVIGNPSLRQKFQNRFNLSFNNYKVLSERSIYVGTNFSTTKNDISSSNIIDKFGRRTTQYLNVDGNYSASIYLGYYIKIPKSKIRVFANPSASTSRTTNFVNGLKNVSQNNNISTNFGAYFYKDKVYELRVGVVPSYNQSKPSISSVAGTQYWSYNYGLNGNYALPGKLEIGSDINFNIRQKLNAFDKNNNVILWNAYVEKKFMKSEALTLRASINDILDQNKGYSRNIQPFSIEEKHYITFQRYGLLTLTWNFNKKGGAAAPK